MDRLHATRRDASTRAVRASGRRGPSARLTALTAFIAAVGVACGGAASIAAPPRPAPAMSRGSYPGAITAGRGGDLWFTEHMWNRVVGSHPGAR